MNSRTFHRTLKLPSNVGETLSGNWMPSLYPENAQGYEQVLFNFHTYILIFHTKQNNYEITENNTYTQQLFTNIGTICYGPKDFQFDSFFATKSNNIILFVYDERENMFIVKYSFVTDRILIDPTFIHFASDKLIISCDHGSLGLYSITPKEQFSYNAKLIKAIKSKGITIATIIQNDGYLARLEVTKYRIYDPSTLDLIAENNLKVDNAQIALVVPYYQGTLFFLAPPYNIYWYRTSQGFSSNLFDYLSVDGTFIDWCPLNTDTIVFLTNNSKLYALNNNSQLYLLPFVQNWDQSVDFARIVMIKHNVILALNTSGESFIFLYQNSVLIPFRTNFLLGLRSIVVCQTGNKILQSIYYHNKAVSISGFGLQNRIKTIENIFIDSEITNLFSQTSNNTTFLVISKINSSILCRYDPSNNTVMTVNTDAFNFNSPTVGFGLLLINNQFVFIQATPDCLYGFNERLERVSVESMKINLIDTNLAFAAYVINNNSVILRNYSTKNQTDFIIDCDKINSVSFSRSNENPLVLFTSRDKIIAYRAKNFDPTKKIEIKVDPSTKGFPVSSLFIDDSVVVIGYNNGLIQILRFAEKPLTIMSKTIGEGAIRLVRGGGNSVLAICSRLYMISLSKNGLISLKPIGPQKANFITSVPRQLICANDKSIGFMICKNLSITFHPEKHEVVSNIINAELLQDHNNLNIVATTKLGIYKITPYDDNNKPKRVILHKANDNETVIASKLDSRLLAWITKNSQNGVYMIYFINMKSSEIVQREFNHEITKIGVRTGTTDSLPDIVCANNSSVYLLTPSNSALNLITKVDIKSTNVTAVSFINNTLLIGDSDLGILMYEYNNASRSFTKMSSINYEGRSFITCISSQAPKNVVAVGDRFGNIRYFNTDPNIRPISYNSVPENYFNVSDPVVGVFPMQSILNDRAVNLIWYSTISGECGYLFIGLSTPQILLYIEDHVCANIMELTGINPHEFRSKTSPSYRIVDLDIVEAYAKLSEERQEKIARFINERMKHQSETNEFTINRQYCLDYISKYLSITQIF